MWKDHLKCHVKFIRVMIHGGDCNLNRKIIMNQLRFSLTSLIKSKKPAGVKKYKGKSA